MASGLILNPQTLLTTLPLASSTGTIVLATSELNFFSTFVHPELRKKSGSILPRYWEYLFPRALPLVLACNLTTIVSSACNIYFRSERRLLPVSKTTLYWLGLAGAIGHLCFVPSVAPPIKRMIEAKDEAVSESTRDMDVWLGIHRVRMVVVSLIFWLVPMLRKQWWLGESKC